jgi:predicted DNA-binding ArsR family transcriptional regulator
MNTQEVKREEIIPTERLISLELKRAVASEADWITEQVDQLLDEIGNTRLTKAQINGLMSVANTTDKVSDVIRLIERQGSRHKEWQQYAERLIREVKGTLLNLAKDVAMKVQEQLRDYHDRGGAEVDALIDRRGRLVEIHVLLVREFIQSFGLGYLYRFLSDSTTR